MNLQKKTNVKKVKVQIAELSTNGQHLKGCKSHSFIVENTTVEELADLIKAGIDGHG